MMTIKKTKNINISAIILAFIIFAGFLFLFWPYFKLLGNSWISDPLNTFGFLVPFVSGWALYRRRKEIIQNKSTGGSAGWFFLVPAVVILIIFYWSRQAFIACVALPLFLYGICLILLGRERSRFFIFPVFILMFLYPWGDLLNLFVGFELRRLSVLLSYFFYRMAGMDAAISGTFLYTGRFTVDVAPACSGLTIMNVLLFMGTIGVYLYQGAVRNKIFIFLSLFPIAILANTVRIILTGLIGHFYGESGAISFYDNISGMVVFGASILMLYSEILIFSAWFKKNRKK